MITNKKIKLINSAIRSKNGFIHFSDVEGKLGINPKTSFDTPAGLYGYLLTRKSFDCVARGIKDFSLTYRLEIIRNCELYDFATDRKFIYIAKVIKEKDKKIIRIKFKDENKDKATDNFTKKELNSAIEKIYKMSKESNNLILERLRKISKAKFLKGIENALYDAEEFFQIDTSNFMKLYAITREFSRNSIAWGRLLYELGIQAIFDYGTSTIHQNEPHQMVLLGTHKHEVIYEGKNKLAIDNDFDNIAEKTIMEFSKKFKIDDIDKEHMRLSERNDNIFLENEMECYLGVSMLNPRVPVFSISYMNNCYYVVLDVHNNKTYITIDPLKNLMVSNSIIESSHFHIFNESINTEAISFKFNPKIIGISEGLPKNDIDLFELFSEFYQDLLDKSRNEMIIRKFEAKTLKGYYSDNISMQISSEIDLIIDEVGFAHIKARYWPIVFVDLDNNEIKEEKEHIDVDIDTNIEEFKMRPIFIGNKNIKKKAKDLSIDIMGFCEEIDEISYSQDLSVDYMFFFIIEELRRKYEEDDFFIHLEDF